MFITAAAIGIISYTQSLTLATIYSACVFGMCAIFTAINPVGVEPDKNSKRYKDLSLQISLGFAGAALAAILAGISLLYQNQTFFGADNKLAWLGIGLIAYGGTKIGIAANIYYTKVSRRRVFAIVQSVLMFLTGIGQHITKRL